MKKRHILMIPAVYLPNGGEYVREQAQLMVEKGYEVRILANLLLPLSYNGSQFFTLPWCRDVHYVDEGIPVQAHYTRRIPKLFRYNVERWVKRTLAMYESYVALYGTPHLIHVHSAAWAGCAAREIKRRYGTPYLITEHLSFDVARREVASNEAWGRGVLQDAYMESEYLISVSQMNYQRGVQQGWIPSELPHTIISNVTEACFFQPRPHPHNSPFTFVAINDYWHPKGYDILLPAVERLEAMGVDFKVRIAGSRFDDASFQRLLHNCKAKHRLEFVGRCSRQEVIALLSQADAMVLPSREEAQSRAVLEALACGVAVVTTDIISPELVHKETGIRVANENPEALAQGMYEMVERATSYSPLELSQWSYNLSAKEFVAERIASVYETLLAPVREEVEKKRREEVTLPVD